MAKIMPEMLLRWNAMEKPLREALRAFKEGSVSAERTVSVVDNLLAAATLRGNELESADAALENEVWDAYEKRLRHENPNDKRFWR